VLARVADTFGTHGVSIASVNQKGVGDEARLVMVTHRALERAMQATLHDLRLLDPVRAVGSVLRVEDEAP
jgi:homoserine dehydrogenase